MVVFKYQGALGLPQALNMGESYTRLGVRKILVNEKEKTIAIE